MTIKNVMRFELTMDHISIDMLFGQMMATIQHAKDRTKIAKLNGMNNSIVRQYTHVLVVVALQQITNMVDHESVWAMSLASDGNTHHDQLFFNLHMRVCYRGNLVNLHLVAMPMFEQHTTLNIFNMISKFMDTLYNKWCAKLS
jgi:Tfp pilus assembly protein PilN